MDLIQRYTIPVGLEDAWQTLTHLESIAGCWPGALLRSVDGDNFAGSLKIKLGATNLVYNGSGRFVVRDDVAKRIVIEAQGEDGRGNGRAALTVTARLQPEGSGTAIEVSTALTITGKPAQLDEAVIADVGDRLLHQFAACVSAKLGATTGLSETVVTTTKAAAGGASAQGSPAEPRLSALHRTQAEAPLLVRRYGIPALGALIAFVAALSLIKRVRRRRAA